MVASLPSLYCPLKDTGLLGIANMWMECQSYFQKKKKYQKKKQNKKKQQKNKA